MDHEVTRIIADVESQLLRLKDAETERKALAARLEEREAEFANREDQLRRTADALRDERAQNIELKNRQAEHDRAVGELRTQIEEQHRSIESLKDQLKRSAEELGEARQRADRSERSAAEGQSRASELQAQLDQTAEQLNRAATEVQRLSGEQTESARALEAAQQRMAGDHEAIQRELSEARAEAQQRIEERDRLAGELQHARESASQQLAASKEAEETLSAERDDLAAQLTNTTQRFEQQLQALKEQLDTSAQRAEHEQQSLQARIDEIASERDHAAQALAEAAGTAERLQQELASSRSELSEDDRRLRDEVETVAQDRDRAREQVRQLEAALAELTKERDALHQQASAAPARVAAGHTGASARAAMPERIESRQRRLAGMRQSVSLRARKLRRASEVLQQRVEQCDTLLTQRRELSAAKRAIDELHRRLERSRAKTTGIVQLTAWLVTLTTLAAVSWVIAGRFAPPHYAATATLAAESVSGVKGDLDAWGEYHVELLTHPRVVERLAARLQRRGMADASTLDAVQEVLEQRLVHREVEPGRLQIEIVQPGRTHAERWMETYVTALVAEANEDRARRRDAMSTGIADPAAASSDPVSDPRPKYAGIGLAASATVAALLWFGLWRTMAKVRENYAASSRLEEILNEARWVDPVPDVARRPSKNAA